MFKHNLFIALRNFKKSKSSFLINLIGLSTGLACTMLIYLWVLDELQVDRFHTLEGRLFKVMEHQQYAGEIMTTSSTPGILSEALAEEIPEVAYAATTTWVNSFTLSHVEKSVKAKGYYVGEDYFNIFSYPLIEGSPDHVLSDKNSIVISRQLALSIFDTLEDILGKSIELQHDETFLVTGIFEDIPAKSSYKFDFVLPFEKFKDKNSWVKEWGNNGPNTYVVLHENSNVTDVNAKIKDFVKGKNDESNVSLFLKPYSEIYLHGRYENGIQQGGRIEYVRLFSIIAIFILFIACINFMNLATARASGRAREVGVKKAIGAKQDNLIIQFLTESMLISFFSLFIALLIVFLFLPQFNQITEKSITLSINSSMVLILIIATFFTGLLAGSYPSLYLANFSPVKVLKGEIRTSLGELWARRGLVIVQFILSIILIVSVMVVYKQIEYVQSKNLGYNKDNVIYISEEGKVFENVDTFISEVKQIPGVVNASSIGHDLVGRQNNTSGLEWEGKDPESIILFENLRINYDLIETMGMEIVEGRAFSREFGADSTKIIINEAGIDVMGLENPVGKTITLWDDHELEIIGVAKNFHFQSLHEPINPLFMVVWPKSTWNVMIRIEAGREKETIERLTNFYKSFNPGFVFDYTFLNQEYAKQYAAEQKVASLSKYFAMFAILISCLGLFGLASFTARRRIKEIGIRKVLGCSNSRIVYLLSRDFSRMVMVSILFAIPLSYLMMRSWLNRFEYQIELNPWFFLMAGLIAILVAWLTVGSQAFRAARTNPTHCLKNE